MGKGSLKRSVIKIRFVREAPSSVFAGEDSFKHIVSINQWLSDLVHEKINSRFFTLQDYYAKQVFCISVHNPVQE